MTNRSPIGTAPNQIPRNSDLGLLAYRDRIPHGRIAITATTVLGKSHMGQTIDVTSGTFALTTDTAANLGYGWWVAVRNSGTGAVTLPTADGVAYVLFADQTKIVYTDGTLFYIDRKNYGLSHPLAVLTPTAAATVDALTTFTAAYDNYLILGEGILPAADDSLRIRFGVAGTADTGSNYYEGASYSAAVVTVAAATINLTGTVTTAGKGCNFELLVQNANDAVRIKSLRVSSEYQTNATPGYESRIAMSTYSAANAISGIRFYWASGSNFAAAGKIYIYGYNNSK